MQALRRLSSGMRASRARSIAAFAHQHGVEKLPLSAGAHALEPPHSGQIGFGLGSMISLRGVKVRSQRPGRASRAPSCCTAVLACSTRRRVSSHVSMRFQSRFIPAWLTIKRTGLPLSIVNVHAGGGIFSEFPGRCRAFFRGSLIPSCDP
jgi:hypothetical protein